MRRAHVLAAATSLVVVASALPACEKDHGPLAGAGMPGDASAAAAPSTDAVAAPSRVGADAGAGAASGSPAVWSGSYNSAAGTLYVPPELKIRWRPVENDAGIGDGRLTVSIDPGTGVVRGTVDGPLGPAVLNGLLAGGTLSATVLRKDPHDQGFAGVLQGKVAGDRLEGTMDVSLASGGALRTATFAMTPGGAPAGR